MLVWIAFALLTAAVLVPVLAPLARPARADEAEGSAEGGTLAVYRDQLSEIEAERTRGLIGEAEAEAAKLEISRRLLKSAAGSERAASRAGDAIPQSRHARLALGTAVAAPLLALGSDLGHGSPGRPSNPFVARGDAARAEAELAEMIAKVEARLSKVPEDGKGWEVIAPVYLKLGRFSDAANAYANAARL